MKDILDELIVPQPPYRMARLAAAEGIKTLEQMAAEEFGAKYMDQEHERALEEDQHRSDEEIMRQHGEQRAAQEEAEWNQFFEQSSTPEQVDVAVHTAAESATTEISANRSVPEPERAATQQAVAEAQAAYSESVAKEKPSAEKPVEKPAEEEWTLEKMEKERDRLLRVAEEAGAAGDMAKRDIAREGAVRMGLRMSGMQTQQPAPEPQPTPAEVAPNGPRIDRKYLLPGEEVGKEADAIFRQLDENQKEIDTLFDSGKDGSSPEVGILREKNSELNRRLEQLLNPQEKAKLEKLQHPEKETDLTAKEPTTEERLQDILAKQTKLRAEGKEAEAKSWDPAVAKYQQWLKEHRAPEAPKNPAIPKPRPAKAPKGPIDIDDAVRDEAEKEARKAEQQARGAEKPVPIPVAPQSTESSTETPQEKRDREEAAESLRRDMAREGEPPLTRARIEEFKQAQAEALKMVAEKEEKEAQAKTPGALDSLREIERMGDTSKPGFWGRAAISMEAEMQGALSWWASIWEKKAKDALARKEEKIKELEKAQDALTNKSWLGTAISPLWYGPRLGIRYWLYGITREALKRHENRRVQHDRARREVFTRIGGRMDAALLTHEEHVKRLEREAENFDTVLDELVDEMRKINIRISVSSDPQEKEKLRKGFRALEAEYDEGIKLRAKYERVRAREEGKAASVRRMKMDAMKARMATMQEAGAEPNMKEESQKRVMRRMQRVAQKGS